MRSGARGGDARAAAEDSLEDYAFRYVPRSFRRWSALSVGGTALGSIAFLADFSIGASIGLHHGTSNAVLGILLASVIIFLVGFPVAYYAARYNLDLDLIARGSGFGYYGSIITTVVFAGFTCIFFALEGAIMAQGLEAAVGIPLPVGYVISTVVVIPIVIFGMRALERLQFWTTPLWLALALLPLLWIVFTEPEAVTDFIDFTGASDGTVSFSAIVASAAVCFALTPQLAEQIDYIRVMPPRTAANARSWWTAFVFSGPGWVIFSGTKQVIGLFLAVYLVTKVDPSIGDRAVEPVKQFLGMYQSLLPDWVALGLALILIVIAQVKINVTNAYSGSLAWSNVYTRVKKRYPGRTVFVVFNLVIALALMLLDVFSLISFVLSLYANVVMAWLVTISADIVINKHLLRISPRFPEFRRGMLHDWNPVGPVSVAAASGLSLLCFVGAFGADFQPFSVLVAIGVAVVVTPAMALATRGRFYLRRRTDGIPTPILDRDGNPSGERLRCHVTGYMFERPDMLASAESGPRGELQFVSSLALALDESDRYVLPPEPAVRERDGPGRRS
ncbi:purine-cytosine permease family protein [Microbacterium hominis]|uniref:purine-cytosine permease family protein n=1 Tax=Microbacterium hominis TaxID=162426 RepID=UPI0020B77EA9|nr:cytosine permease [Microbacterium hominis]